MYKFFHTILERLLFFGFCFKGPFCDPLPHLPFLFKKVEIFTSVRSLLCTKYVMQICLFVEIIIKLFIYYGHIIYNKHHDVMNQHDSSSLVKKCYTGICKHTHSCDNLITMMWLCCVHVIVTFT